MSVIQHLKQDIEYIRMRFLDLIKEYHRIWMPSDFFAELSAVLMSYISRRGADQLGYAVFFHVFGHVDPDHGLFVPEQCLSQCLGKLGLSDSCRSKEEE